MHWENIIEDAVAAVPEFYRQKVRNVAILLEDEPSDVVRAEQGLAHDETLLGLYQGIPLPERGSEYGVGETVPDTITLYRTPILEEAGGDPLEVARVVRETVWHEFGHYFGLSEEEVERREEERAVQNSIKVV
jgi:predicted Zn-dependent protease with MMP-like domain